MLLVDGACVGRVVVAVLLVEWSVETCEGRVGGRLVGGGVVCYVFGAFECCVGGCLCVMCLLCNVSDRASCEYARKQRL